MGHFLVLQVCSSDSGALQGFVSSDLVLGRPHSLFLCCLPPPHVTEHCDHSDHGPSSKNVISKISMTHSI